MQPQSCSFNEVSPLVTQFVENTVQRIQEKVKSDKQRNSHGITYNKEFFFKDDEKFNFVVKISIDCSQNKYDINTLKGKVNVWTTEFQTGSSGPKKEIPAERMEEIVKRTQSLAEIYTPIFQKFGIPLS